MNQYLRKGVNIMDKFQKYIVQETIKNSFSRGATNAILFFCTGIVLLSFFFVVNIKVLSSQANAAAEPSLFLALIYALIIILAILSFGTCIGFLIGNMYAMYQRNRNLKKADEMIRAHELSSDAFFENTESYLVDFETTFTNYKQKKMN